MCVCVCVCVCADPAGGAAAQCRAGARVLGARGARRLGGGRRGGVLGLGVVCVPVGSLSAPDFGALPKFLTFYF